MLYIGYFLCHLLLGHSQLSKAMSSKRSDGDSTHSIPSHPTPFGRQSRSIMLKVYRAFYPSFCTTQFQHSIENDQYDQSSPTGLASRLSNYVCITILEARQLNYLANQNVEHQRQHRLNAIAWFNSTSINHVYIYRFHPISNYTLNLHP